MNNNTHARKIMEASTGEILPLSSASPSLYFIQIEVISLREFLHTVTIEELRQLLKMFKTRCLISKEMYTRLDQIHRQSGDMDEMFTLLITHLSERCISGLQYVFFVMYSSGYQNLAYTLYTIYQNILEMFKRKPPQVQRLDTRNRKKIQIYFKSMKTNLQNMIFLDPVDYFMKRSIEFRQKIYTTVPSSEDTILQEFCDKYVVALAFTIDTMANKTNHIDPNHKLFRDMESIISFTSCPDLSRCILYGRRAVVLSFANKKGEGEGLLREGLICAQRVSSCLEIVDLHYKSVLFLRAWFEHFPQIILNRIYGHMQSAMQILENEQDDVRRFWTQRFIFRLLCCFLGLGMRCRFIEKFNCPFNILQEAERLLNKYDTPDAECRLQMYFAIAKSRLWNLKGDNDAALEYISQAKEIACRGNFSELKTISAAEQVLFLSDVQPLFVETENNNFTDIIIAEPIHLPPSYHLPSSSNFSDHSLTLTSRSISEISISVQGSNKEEEIGNEIHMPSEEAAISHDFSREVVHLRSAKINRETI
ncbi:uncharacterized protein LOC125660490 [Ostrea edulis]|uniref:uncharacterized protein LOC125660490 n=1 Tax=Ostrea edulis TaxID=37623 RepID=UPI0024AFEEA2|nr:uncharacterized protein LOC125660490 [Ostrea edulis]